MITDSLGKSICVLLMTNMFLNITLRIYIVRIRHEKLYFNVRFIKSVKFPAMQLNKQSCKGIRITLSSASALQQPTALSQNVKITWMKPRRAARLHELWGEQHSFHSENFIRPLMLSHQASSQGYMWRFKLRSCVCVCMFH